MKPGTARRVALKLVDQTMDVHPVGDGTYIGRNLYRDLTVLEQNAMAQDMINVGHDRPDFYRNADGNPRLVAMVYYIRPKQVPEPPE